MVIQLYSKRRCPLCDEARAILHELHGRYTFELIEQFIEDSPSDWERFRYDVPVVFVDGDRLFTHRIDRDLLEQRLTGGGTGVAHLRDRNG